VATVVSPGRVTTAGVLDVLDEFDDDDVLDVFDDDDAVGFVTTVIDAK
jgi:hypothetical protein